MGKRKIGSNAPCPCGSGKKFKKCCRDKVRTLPPEMFGDIQMQSYERERQQGLGRPIIAETLQGQRFVAVGSRLYRSAHWKTFHDFLLDYLADILGTQWLSAELKKPEAQRHPLLKWRKDIAGYLNARIKQPGEVSETQMTGLVGAYLGLAYNLYLMEHNVKLQQRLVHRLTNADQFRGAFYEAYVIGALIRAGFDIELEDESDNTSTHCELTATFRSTGNKFSVEAKARLPNKTSLYVGNQLHEALRKRAKFPRIVFIEVNVSGNGTRDEQTKLMKEVLSGIRSREPGLLVDGNPAPAAYLIITNTPAGTVDGPYERAAIAEGFKIPDYKAEGEYRTLREALEARRRHGPIDALMRSLREHSRIPATFDGTVPTIECSDKEDVLRIGQRYEIQTEKGPVVAELTHAEVFEEQKKVGAVFRLPEGNSLCSWLPLSDAQLQAYKYSPQTCFGVLQPKQKVNDALELYDLIYAAYRHNSKEHFLNTLLTGQPDIETLKTLDQPALAEIYAERQTEAIARDMKLKSPLA